MKDRPAKKTRRDSFTKFSGFVGDYQAEIMPQFWRACTGEFWGGGGEEKNLTPHISPLGGSGDAEIFLFDRHLHGIHSCKILGPEM